METPCNANSFFMLSNVSMVCNMNVSCLTFIAFVSEQQCVKWTTFTHSHRCVCNILIVYFNVCQFLLLLRYFWVSQHYVHTYFDKLKDIFHSFSLKELEQKQIQYFLLEIGDKKIGKNKAHNNSRRHSKINNNNSTIMYSKGSTQLIY